MIVQEYKSSNPSLAIQSLCRAFGLARSSFYSGVKSIRRNDKLDKIVWDSIVDIWEIFPGFGYRKLAKKLGYTRAEIESRKQHEISMSKIQ